MNVRGYDKVGARQSVFMESVAVPLARTLLHNDSAKDRIVGFKISAPDELRI